MNERVSRIPTRRVDTGATIAAVRTRVGDSTAAIHVMDRGADSYELFAAIMAHGDRFVVRLNHDRRVETDTGPGTLHEVPSHPVLCEREVREGRIATLQCAARRLTVPRPTAAAGAASGGRRQGVDTHADPPRCSSRSHAWWASQTERSPGWLVLGRGMRKLL